MALIAAVDRSTRRLSEPILTAAAGTFVALFSWPLISPVPSAGVDQSWTAALYMALEHGIQFGTEFAFTYGPLGFLEQPVLYDSGLWVVSFLYHALIYVALAIALVWAGRRSLPLPLAAALAYAMLVIGTLEAASVLLVFVLASAAVDDSFPMVRRWLVPIGGGLLAAVELMAKINFGIAILLLCLVALAAVPRRRRNLPLFLGAFAAGFLVLWIGAGQSPTNLADFASTSAQVLGGYSSAMAVNVSDVSWQLPWAVAAIALLAGVTGIPWRNEPVQRRVGAILLVLIFGFATFKQSFVRQGLGNGTDFFPLMLGAGIGIAWRLPRRMPKGPPGLPAALLLAPLVVLSAVALPSPSLWGALQPRDHLEFLRQDARALFSGDERRKLAGEGRERMTAAYRLDPRTLSLLRGRSVDVEPWETTVVWAYRLDWRPLPVPGYTAYTPALDRLDAEALSGTKRPLAILRQSTRSLGGYEATIDRRNTAWDPPAAMRAMLCHFRPVRTTERWQVLYPAADRCGAPELLKRVTARTGTPIGVPKPARGSIVFARVDGLGTEGLETLRTLLYRGRERWLTVNGRRSWRVVPATLGDGLILRADPQVDFPAPFALAPEARFLSLRLAGGSRRIEVGFYAMPVSRPGPRR